MDTELEIGSQGAHLNGEDALGNEFTRPAAGETHPQDAFGLRIDQEFGQTVAAAHGGCPAGGGPGKTSDFNCAVFAASLRFGQSAPGNFRVRKHHGWDRLRLKGHAMTGNGFHRAAALV